MDTFEKSLSPDERRLIRGLRTPYQIQLFLDSVPYSGEDRYRSPATFLRDRMGHCFDGAAFAAAMLSRLGHRPLIIDLLPNDRDDDHMLAPFQRDGHWGALAKSNFSGLRYREPVYRSVRELVMSYFDDYFNDAGEKTLRGYTRPLDLESVGRPDWRLDDGAMDVIADRLGEIRQFKVLTPRMVRHLVPVDPRSLQAGLLGSNQDGLYHPPRQ